MSRNAIIVSQDTGDKPCFIRDDILPTRNGTGHGNVYLIYKMSRHILCKTLNRAKGTCSSEVTILHNSHEHMLRHGVNEQVNICHSAARYM